MQEQKFEEIMIQLSDIFMLESITKSFFHDLWIEDLTEIELNFKDIYEIFTLSQIAILVRRITFYENSTCLRIDGE